MHYRLNLIPILTASLLVSWGSTELPHGPRLEVMAPALAQTGTPAVATLRLAGEDRHYAGQLTAALATLQQALSQAAAAGDRGEMAASHLALAEVYISRDAKPVAADHAQQAQALYQALGDAAGAAEALRVLALTQFDDTPTAETLATAAAALALAQSHGSRVQQGLILADLAVYHALQQDWSTALDLLQQAELLLASEPLSPSEAGRRTYYQPLVWAWQGLVQFQLGTPDSNPALFAQAIAQSQANNSPYGEAVARFFQGVVWVNQGQIEAGIQSYQVAAERFAAAENQQSQWDVLWNVQTLQGNQAWQAVEAGEYAGAIGHYEAALATLQTALPVALALDDPATVAKTYNEISNLRVSVSQTAYRAANQALGQRDFDTAEQQMAVSITAAEASVAPALEALALVPVHQDDALTATTHQIVHTAHIAVGQAHEFQSLIYRAAGRFADSLPGYEVAATWYAAAIEQAIAAEVPQHLAKARYNEAMAYSSLGQVHSALQQNEAAIQMGTAALERSQQVLPRGATLLILSSLQQYYYDASEAASSAGDYDQALTYSQQLETLVQQGMALATAPLEDPSTLPAAVLPASSIIDTEAEQQKWQQGFQDRLWLMWAQRAFIYDEQDQPAQALEYFQAALTVLEGLDRPDVQGQLLSVVAATQVQLSQYPEAIASQEQAIALATQQQNENQLLTAKLSLASIYDDLGRYPAAIATYEEVLALTQTQARIDLQQTVLNNLGVIYTFQGNYAAALANFDQGLTLARHVRAQLETPEGLAQFESYCSVVASAAETAVDSDPAADGYDVAVDTFQSVLAAASAEHSRQLCIDTTWDTELKLLNNMAVVYDNQGQYQTAIESYETALTIAEEWSGQATRANILNNLANTFHSQGEYQRALTLYQETLAMRQTMGDRAGAANSLNSLGSVYKSQGQYDQALTAYDEALNLVQTLGLRPMEPTILGNIGTIYSDRGDYDTGTDYYQRSLALAKDLGLLPDQARQIVNLGTIAFKRGQYPQALADTEQALELYREMGARIAEGSVLRTLGTIYQAQGNFADALAAHEASLAIAQELSDRDDEAEALLSLGSSYTRLGQYETAIAYVQQGLALFRTQGNVAGAASALRSLGNIAEQQERYVDALPLYEQALAIYQSTGSLAGESLTLIDIGFAQRQLGNLEAAETALQRSLTMQREMGTQASEGLTLTGLALVRREQGQPQAALELLQAALTLSQELGDRPQAAASLREIGELLAAQEEPELAIVFLKRSVNTFESIRGQLSGVEVELQTAYTESVADAYRMLAELLLGQGRILEAQRVLDLLKVQELDAYFQDVQRRSTTQAGVDFWQVEVDLLALYQEVLDQAAELRQLESKAPGGLTATEQERLATLRARRDEAEGWFYNFLDDPSVIATVDQIRSSTRGQNLEPENFPDLANNLRQLPRKTAALYPLILEDRLELVLIMPEGPPLRYPVAVTAAELNPAIVEFGQALKSPFSDIEPLAQELYGWLVAPLAEQLEQAGIESIIYAPDGVLRYVPLAALHDGSQYLAEQYSVSYITAASLTDLNLQPQRQTRRTLAAACAECSFTVTVGDRRFTFADLPFTAVEVETIAKQVSDAVVLLNQEFNATALSNLPGYSIVHLATHAAFVTGSPDESFIVFGSGETINLRNIKREWQLDNAELVVLSACETAVGSTDLGSGIEILGLGYRLEQAGAQATLASLWQVSDGGTQILMAAFYGALQQGLPKAEALQAAQQALISNDFSAVGGDRGLAVVNDTSDRAPLARTTLAHPYYWAPFILIGNGL